MVKRLQHLLAFSLFVVFVCSGATYASGFITFQLEVIPGFTIANPDNLVFPPVAPGQTIHQELTITVWSNVRWNLSIRATGEELEGVLFGMVEVEGENGDWHDLFGGVRTLRSSQSPTGPHGRGVHIPFRFAGSYSDTPGLYSFQVEFTVVPAL